MNLFLDDIRMPYQAKVPQNSYTIVRSYNEFIKTITDFYNETKELPKLICFDHDLSDEHYSGDFSKGKTGLDCAKWLVGFCKYRNLNFPEYIVHSMNPVGKQNIINCIEDFK